MENIIDNFYTDICKTVSFDCLTTILDMKYIHTYIYTYLCI